MKKTIITITVCAALAACAGPHGAAYVPLVDLRTPSQAATYPSDLAQCQQYARQRMDAGQGAAVGAIAGALFGALLGAAAGGNSHYNAQVAGVGLLTGAAGGAVQAEGSQREIIVRCLSGRGYLVLQ